MIGYVTIGTNDFDKAAAYYDALLATLNGERVMEMDTFIAWGSQPGSPMVVLTRPYDGNEATVGNGMMVALAADTPESVARVYEKAMELGSQDEGAPGPRGSSGLYAAYFRDKDGNKLCVFCLTQ